MGFECFICGEQKSGMAISYSLDLDHTDWSVCRECDSKKEGLEYFAGKKGKEAQYEKKKEYFLQKMRENSGMRMEVRDYLRAMIAKYDVYDRDAPPIKIETSRRGKELEGFLLSTAGLPESYELIQNLGILSANDTYIAGVVGGILTDVFVDQMSHLEEMRKTLEQKLALQAKEAGANALIGIQFQFVTLADHYYGVFVIGTAAVVREKKQAVPGGEVLPCDN